MFDALKNYRACLREGYGGSAPSLSEVEPSSRAFSPVSLAQLDHAYNCIYWRTGPSATLFFYKAMLFKARGRIGLRCVEPGALNARLGNLWACVNFLELVNALNGVFLSEYVANKRNADYFNSEVCCWLQRHFLESICDGEVGGLLVCCED